MVSASTEAVTYKLVGLRSSGTCQKKQVSKAISLDACFFCFCVVANITFVCCQKQQIPKIPKILKIPKIPKIPKIRIFLEMKAVFSAAAPSIFKMS